MMKCKVCGITDKDFLVQTGRRFYDSGVHRSLCSKECYSVIFDELFTKQEHAVELTRGRTRERRARDPRVSGGTQQS